MGSTATIDPWLTARLLDALPEPSVLLDADGQIAVANVVAERAMGVARDALTGRAFGEVFLAKSERRRHHEALLRGLAANLPVLCERELVQVQRADGSEAPAALTMKRLDRYVVAVLSPLGAQPMTDARQHSSPSAGTSELQRPGAPSPPSGEALLRDLLTRAPLIIWTTDLDLRYSLIRGGALGNLPLGQDQLVGVMLVDTCAAGKNDVIYRAHERALAGETVTYETTGPSTLTFTCRVEQLCDAQGRPIGVFGTAIDISERRRAEEQLLESHTRFQQLADNIREVFWMTDLEKNAMLYVSPGYETIWGRTPQSLIENPRDWLEAIHPQDRPHVVEAMSTKQTQGTYDEIYRIVRPDGTHRWIRDRAFVIKNEAGKPTRLAGLAADITETRRTEEHLRQSQKLEAIGNLAAGIAHDFNNLLSVILTASTYAAAELGSAHRLFVDIREIRQAGERAALLTRQLLAFGRQQVVQKRRVDLNEILLGLQGLLGHALRKDIEVNISPATRLSPILADPGQIEQIVVNLAMNAGDAMPTPGKLSIVTADVELDATTARYAGIGAGKYVMLSVADTGTGMDRETLGRIFEPFFTTKSRDKGTGLGLATVFGIVKQNAGGIFVNSEPGEGSTFYVYFPSSQGTVRRTPKRRKKENETKGSETILVVEDEDRVRAAARTILTRHGYRVLEANGPTQGLDIGQGHEGTIDLLLTDVIMPGMNGIQLAHRLAEIRPGMKVLCMSGYADETALQRGLSDANIAFLQKPLTPDGLSRKVREVLNAG